MSADIIQFPGMIDLPNRIREFRAAKSMSQQQLADLIHVSKPTISELETGKMQLTVDYMRRIGRALNLAPAELLNFEDQMIVLSEQELLLVRQFRRADAIQREMILRLAAPRETDSPTSPARDEAKDETLAETPPRRNAA